MEEVQPSGGEALVSAERDRRDEVLLYAQRMRGQNRQLLGYVYCS